MTEKKITRVRVQLDDNEIASLNDTMAIVSCLFEPLVENQKVEYISTATGEVIEMDDLKRVNGILSGLIHCREWILE